VKEVTTASHKVVGTKRRDATIKALKENRTKYPKQESKVIDPMVRPTPLLFFKY